MTVLTFFETRAFAIQKPIPWLAPVTIARFPDRSPESSFCIVEEEWVFLITVNLSEIGTFFSLNKETSPIRL